MAHDPSKTEKATPKRRNKVRNEGNVAKSQELTKTATIVAGALALYAYSPVIFDHVSRLFRYFFGHSTEIVVSSQNAYALFILAVKELAIMVLPIILFIAFAAFIVLRIQVGKLWTTKVFKPKLSRFNPINGLKRMIFSPQTFIRLGKNLALALAIGAVPYWFIKREMDTFIMLYYTTAEGLGVYMLKTAFKMVQYTLIPMIIIAVADWLITRFQYERNLKMTKQEIKDERKQAEGDPAIKNKQRQKMMQVLASRMMQEVPKADLVITNPTHLAVALRYDPTICPAPLVVAKGADKVAEKIKTIARQSGVPIKENKPLARSLYKQVEVGQPIPEDLYKAVAGLLAEIWKLQGKMPQRPAA